MQLSFVLNRDGYILHTCLTSLVMLNQYVSSPSLWRRHYCPYIGTVLPAPVVNPLYKLTAPSIIILVGWKIVLRRLKYTRRYVDLFNSLESIRKLTFKSQHNYLSQYLLQYIEIYNNYIQRCNLLRSPVKLGLHQVTANKSKCICPMPSINLILRDLYPVHFDNLP